MATETDTSGQVAPTGDVTTQNVTVLPQTPADVPATATTPASVLDSAPSSAWIAIALIGVGILAVFFLTKKRK